LKKQKGGDKTRKILANGQQTCAQRGSGMQTGRGNFWADKTQKGGPVTGGKVSETRTTIPDNRSGLSNAPRQTGQEGGKEGTERPKE